MPRFAVHFGSTSHVRQSTRYGTVRDVVGWLQEVARRHPSCRADELVWAAHPRDSASTGLAGEDSHDRGNAAFFYTLLSRRCRRSSGAGGTSAFLFNKYASVAVCWRASAVGCMFVWACPLPALEARALARRLAQKGFSRLSSIFQGWCGLAGGRTICPACLRSLVLQHVARSQCVARLRDVARSREPTLLLSPLSRRRTARVALERWEASACKRASSHAGPCAHHPSPERRGSVGRVKSGLGARRGPALGARRGNDSTWRPRNA